MTSANKQSQPTPTYSLHKIYDREQIPFSSIEYSKFKFGDKNIAKKFGFALATGFINEYLKKNSSLRSKQLVIYSSPYSFIPTATYAMKDYFIQKLNLFLVNSGCDVVQENKIHRTITYKEDYGDLTAEQRMALIGNDGFHIDKSFTEDKMMIFMDDIKITGSHERVIKRMADEYDLHNEMMFLYFAELANKEIHPNIENQLNYAFVKNLLDLDKIIKNDSFLLNTRVVKFILGAKFDEFSIFIQYQSIKLVQNIYHQAIGNGYLSIPDYKQNLEYIGKLLNKNL